MFRNEYDKWKRGEYLLSRDVICNYFSVDKINELLDERRDLNDELFFILKKIFSDFHCTHSVAEIYDVICRVVYDEYCLFGVGVKIRDVYERVLEIYEKNLYDFDFRTVVYMCNFRINNLKERMDVLIDRVVREYKDHVSKLKMKFFLYCICKLFYRYDSLIKDDVFVSEFNGCFCKHYNGA